MRMTLMTLLALALMTGSARAATLAAWDVWADSSTPYVADSLETGFSATITTTEDRYNSGFGSTDGDFGAALSGASTGLGGILVRENGSNLVVPLVITNNTGSSYSIDSLHFDFGVRVSSPNSFTLTYTSGGLGVAGTQIDSQSGLADLVGVSQGEDQGDYYDFDYNLASYLTDTTLDDGESATFTWVFSGHTSASGSSIVDNFAVQGAVVPEPASLALLAMGIGMVALRRRR